MPVLKGYTAPLGEAPIFGGRSAGAEDFGATGITGEPLQKAVNAQVADMEDNESRKALVASSAIRAKYAAQLDQAALSGADLAPIKQQMQDEFTQMGSQFQTKKGVDMASLYSTNATSMFDEQANHINVTRASSDAKLQGIQFVTNESAIIRTNPEYLKVAEDNATQFMETYKNKLPPELRATMADSFKKDFNVEAAASQARTNPEATLDKLKAGEWNLTTGQREALIGRSEEEIRAKRTDTLFQQEQAQKKKNDANDAAFDTHVKNIIGGKGSARAIMDDPALKPQTRENLIEFMHTRATEMREGANRSDPQTTRNLWLRVNAQDGDPNKIYDNQPVWDAVKAGTINTDTANQLMSMVAMQKDPNGRGIGQRMAVMSSTMGRALSQDPQFTAQPALVAEIQNNYQARMLDLADKLRKDKQDPTTILDPNSKNYVGSREFIQQSIDAARQQQAASLPKAQQVNSAAEYDALSEGTPYVDSSGHRGVKKGKAVAVSSGTQDFADWMNATGGALKPGQTQQQAIDEYKGRK